MVSSYGGSCNLLDTRKLKAYLLLLLLYFYYCWKHAHVEGRGQLAGVVCISGCLSGLC